MKKLGFLFFTFLALSLIIGCATIGGRGQEIRLNTEVVIVGAGGAGYAAGLEALRAGRDVVIIEKHPTITGGNTGVAGSAANAANMPLIRSLNMQITDGERDFIERMINEYWDYPDYIVRGWARTLRPVWDAHRAAYPALFFDHPSLHALQTYYGGSGVAKPSFVHRLAHEALAAFAWLEGLDGPGGGGWLTDRLPAAVGATWRRSHTPNFYWGTLGANFFRPVEAAFLQEGGRLYMGHRADTIIMENGRAVGVSGTTVAGQRFVVRASRGVMLATGGFAANREMLNQHNRWWPEGFMGVGHTNLEHIQGDGIVMAARAGANLIDMEWIQMVSALGSVMEGGAITNVMMINTDGNRFIREDHRRDLLCLGIITQPGQIVWGIQDGHTIDDILGGHTWGANIPFDQWVAALPAHRKMADTLQDLASQIGVPYATLRGHIDAFNRAVEGTAPCPFGRMVFQYPINKPPFVAVQATANIHHTMGGVDVNDNMQALAVGGGVIPGLYAAGEVIGGVHGDNRLGANAITDILVFGRHAGKILGGPELRP